MAKRAEINEEEASILSEAIQVRSDELAKIAASLMKKKLPDAAGPVYDEIKRLQRMKNSFSQYVPEREEKEEGAE